MKTSSLFSEVYEKLWKKIVQKNSVIPFRRMENITIEKSRDDACYPHVIQLKNSFLFEKLLEDFTLSIPCLKNEERNFFQYRDTLLILRRPQIFRLKIFKKALFSYWHNEKVTEYL